MNAPAPQAVPMADNPFSAPVVAAPTGASAQALMQREISDVQSAMLIARRFPRDQRAAVDRILMSCTRPSLAEDAVYQYARGGQDVTGASIRLAEEIARNWGNMTCGVAEVSRFGGQSEVLAYAQDLETGFRDEKRFTVRHWRDTKGGGKAVTEERDIYELIANMGARRKRACILAIVPSDVVEAAIKQCEITLQGGQGEVTADRIKAMIEGFAPYKVTPEMIAKRIQRNLDSITPALLANLRKIYTSLKDGMSSPADWFEVPAAPATAEDAAATPAPATAGNEAAKQKLRAAAPGGTGGTGPTAQSGPLGATVTVGIAAQYTEASAIAELRAAKDATALKHSWREIRGDYEDTHRELPLAIEAAYHEKADAFEENL